MSFPQINQNIDSFHNLNNLTRTEDLLYLLSLKYTDGLSDKSLYHVSNQEDQRGLEAYQDLVDFQKDTYLKLRKEQIQTMEEQSRGMIRALVNSRNEFFYRSSMCFQKIAEYSQNKAVGIQKLFQSFIEHQTLPQKVYYQCLQTLITPSLLSNPAKWPWQIEEFQRSLVEKQVGSLFYEPEFARSEIHSNLSRITQNMKPEYAQIVVQTRFELALREASVASLLQSLLLFQRNEILPLNFRESLNMIQTPKQQNKLHYMRSLCNSGVFHVNYIAQFAKLNFNSISFTASPEYLYIIISCTNGVMLKIGTGQKGTQAGRVYYSKRIKRAEELAWVYLKGKLYLRSHSKEVGSIEVIDTNTFQTVQTLNLHCPEIFQHPSLQIINKNYPILTDGEKLYIVGRRLNIQREQTEQDKNEVSQRSIEQIKAEIEQQIKKREEKLKNPAKKKGEEKPKETDDATTQKLIEYVLYEFDVTNPDRNQIDDDEEDTSVELLNEVYESYQGFFSKKECQRALNINRNDVSAAVQWLTEEGEKERTKTTISSTRKTLLAQAEVTSDISIKNLKNNAELTCSDRAILHPRQVSGNIWTMNKDQVTVYTEQGVLIFSKHQTDLKNLPELKRTPDTWSEKISQEPVPEKKTNLKGTLLQVIDQNAKTYYIHPGYCVSYEAETKQFYIFHYQWNQQTNQFPCLITVSDDGDKKLELQQNPFDGDDFSLALTSTIIKLQTQRFNQQWKINDWEFAYVMILKDIEQRLSHSSNEEEKKKLRSDKTKYINKLNRVIEFGQVIKTKPIESSLREIRKSYMFQLNGDLLELQILFELIQGAKTPQIKFNILILIQLWAKFSDVTIGYSQEGFQLLRKLSSYFLDQTHKKEKQIFELIIDIVTENHSIFMQTNREQIEWLELLSENKESLIKFCKSFSSQNNLKESKIENEPKRDINLTPQSEILTLYPKVNIQATQSDFTEPWFRLLVRHVGEYSKEESSRSIYYKSFYIEGGKDITPQEIENHQKYSDRLWKLIFQLLKIPSIDLHQFLAQLFENSWNQLTLIVSSKLEWQLKTELAKKVLLFFDETLSLFQGNANLEMVDQFCSSMKTWFHYLFASSVTASPEDGDISHQLVKLFGIMKSYLEYKDSDGKVLNLLQMKELLLLRTPGVDPTTEKSFETAHPYERGKMQYFEETHFPGALALLIEFDQRCSSDPSHDFLTISSWYTKQQQQGGVSQAIRDPLGITYRISGKITIKRPIVVLGNHIQSEFHPSGHARNEHSLNRWGFKFTVKPIYGVEKAGIQKALKQEDLKPLQKLFTIDTAAQWINSMRLLSMLILENVHNLIGFDETRTAIENLHTPLLKWTLLKNGPVNFSIDKYLVKQPGTSLYNLVNKLEFQDCSFLKQLSNISMKNKEQPRYWQLKRELFKISYHPNFDLVGENIQNYQDILQKEETLESLWETVINNNRILSDQLRQVKEQNGLFYELALSFTSQFQDSYAYRQEKMRPSYKSSKSLWQQAEVLLVLVVLYHSGLMHIEIPNIKEYLQSNIETLSDARNECINHMIMTVQVEKEWQQNADTIDQCWDELLENKKIQDELKLQSESSKSPSIVPQIEKKEEQLDGQFVRKGNQLIFKKNTNQKNQGKRKNRSASLKKKEDTSSLSQPSPPLAASKSEDQVIEKSIDHKRYIDEKMEKALWQNFSLRLEGNSEMVIKLCRLRGIKTQGEEIQNLLKELFKDLINALSDKKQNEYKDMMQSPYINQYNIVVRRGLLLLMVNNVKLEEKLPHFDQTHSEQSVDSESLGHSGRKLKPPGIGRSVSHQLDDKNVDSQKLLKFRLWLDSYQKWKQLHSVPSNDELNCENPDIPPVKSVVSFIKSDQSVGQQLIEIMKIHDKRCVRRIVGLQVLNEFSNICAKRHGEMNNILSPLIQVSTNDILTQKIELSSVGAKQLLLNEIFKRLNFLINVFNDMTQQARNLNLVFQNTNQSTEQDAAILEQMKLVLLNGSEINQLLSLNDRKLWSHQQFCEQIFNTSLFESFLDNVLQTALLNVVLSNLGPNFQPFSLMAHHTVMVMRTTIFLVTDNGLPKQLGQVFKTTIRILEQEIGISGQNIDSRQLVKLNDLIGLNRVNLLLSHIHDLIMTNRSGFNGFDTHIIELLLFILYHSQIPSTVRFCVKSLKVLFNETKFDIWTLNSPLKKKYLWQSLNLENFIDRIQTLDNIKRLQLKVETRTLQFEQPTSDLVQDPTNPLMLIIEKLGQIIVAEEIDKKSLQSTLQNELSQITYRMKPQRSGKQRTSLNQEEKRFKVLVQLCDEEEISHLVQVLYYWEELYPSVTLRLPKSIEEYIEVREREKKREESKNEAKSEVTGATQDIKLLQQAKALSQYKVLERELLTHPDVIEFQEQLNLGWGFNQGNLFGDMKVTPTENKKQSTPSMRKSVKKNWTLPNTEELERRFDEFLKLPFDVKTLKTPEEIQVFLEQRNFARRIYQHIQEVMYLSRQLQVYGYGAFSDLFTLQKAQELMGLIKLSIEGRLEPIPLPQSMPEDMAKKLDPNQFLLVGTLASKEQAQGQKKSRGDRQEQKQKDQTLQNPRVTNNISNMVVSLVDANIFTLLEFRMDYITLLPQQTSQASQQSYMPISFYNEANRCETIGLYHSSGAAMSQIVAYLVEFLGYLSNNNQQMEQSVKVSFEKALVNAKQETNKYDEVYVVGLSTIFAGWSQQISPGLPVYIKQLKHEEQKLYIIEGGLVSGQKQCQLIGDQDYRLNLQQVKLEDIELYPQVQFDLKKFLNQNNYTQLLQTIYLINQNIKQIDTQHLYKAKNLFIILRNLLHICAKLDWTEMIENTNEEQNQLFKQVLQVLMQQAKPGPDIEFNFCEKWERLIDRQSPLANSIYYPQDNQISQSLQKFIKNKVQIKQTNVDQCDLNEQFIENINTAVLTPSSYVSSLPEPVTPQNEHKMLRYWENYIIPKMQDYVRGSLKPWEFEDFFEQIRQPLRKGDQAKALEISYIICDQRLPNGVVVPDANHDWSTLNIEELIPGQLVIARLSDKNNEQTYSRQLYSLKVKGVQYLLGQVIGVEMRSSSVLILHNDCSSSHLFTTWFPSSALKSLQTYVPVPSNSFQLSNINEEFFKALQEQTAQKSFALLMQLTQGKNLKLKYSLVKNVDIQLIPVIELAIQQELQSNCIDAWLKNQGNQVELPQTNKKQLHPQGVKQRTDHYLRNIQARYQIQNANQSSTRLNEIQDYMDHISNEEVNLLLEWGQNKIAECVKFIAQNTRTMDLSKALGKRNPVPLNKCQSKVSGLCIVFKNDSVLCLCSGLKFYSDHTGVNNFHSLAAGKESRHKLPPLVFNQQQVYCEYFFNSEALPPYQQGSVTSSLVCNVYPIPQQWNTCFWLVDALSTSVIRQNNQQTIKVLQHIIKHLTLLSKQLNGPHLLVQQLFKLLMRTIRKLRYFARLTKLPGSNLDLLGLEISSIIDWVEQAKQLHEQQKQELSGLYSAYLQDLVELIAVTIAPINKSLIIEQLPTCFSNYAKLITLMDFIKNEGNIPDDLQYEVQSMLKIDQQWERVILIKGLPQFWNKDMIHSVLEKGKARVLNPVSDVIIDGSICFILLDGWASLDLEEESQDQKRREEQEQQQKEQEQPPEPVEEEELKWVCDQCTFANGWEAPNCDMCLTPAPPNKKPMGQMLQEEVQEDEPPKVDLTVQEQQVALKDQERFNTLVSLFEQTISESVENLKKDNSKEIETLKVEIIRIESLIEQLLKPEQPQQKEEQQKPPPQKTSKSQKSSKRNIPIPAAPKQQQKQVEQPAQPQENPEQLKQQVILLKQKLEELTVREFVNKSKVQQGKSVFQDQECIGIFRKRLNLGRKSDYTNICCEALKALKSFYERVSNDEQMRIVATEQANKFFEEGALSSEAKFFESINKMLDQDPLQVWKFLEVMGYDFWLNESGLYQKQSINQILRLDTLSQLIRFIENDVCKETKAVLTYQCQNIRFPALSYQLVDESPPINYGEYTTSLLKYPELANSPLRLVRISWAFLRLMNQSLDEAGVFINMEIPNDQTSSHFKPGVLLLQTANYISVLRAFYMAPIKIELVQKVLHKTALPRDGPPKIHVERLKLARDSEQQKKITAEIISSKNKDDFLFTRAFEQMREIPSTQLRPIKPTGTDPFLAFEINFKGEDVQGESGPYRQFFADISRELEPRLNTERNLNLLVPSINNLARMGNAKDKFVLNPSARSTYQLQLFEFLGSLMGCSVRTATHFTLDLPGIFWKQLVGESVSAEEIDEVDATMSNLFQFLDECSPEMFESSFNENWVTLKSDRTVQELRKNGSKHQVQYHERQEYMDKLLQVKLTESEQQNNVIKKGLAKIIPQPLLNLITAQNLELWVCGRAKVDIDLLRRHTRYSGELNESTPRVKFLWEVLNEITEEEKLRFVKFCWGQERLPANDEEFERNQIRFMIKPATYATNQPDRALPKADTCFFNIELPKYSTKEILKQRLLTAINFDCDSMNAESRVQLDPNAHYRRGEEDSDYDDNYGEEEEGQEEE